MVFDAHDRAFAFFKGTCTRGIYDNMKNSGGGGLHRQGAPLQTGASCRCAATIWSSRSPARLRRGWEEGPGREPGWSCPRAVLHPTASGSGAWTS